MGEEIEMPMVDYRASFLSAQAELKEARQRVERDQETIDLAWGLIANAGGGDWSKETPEWRRAAVAWRDERYSPETAIESVLDRHALAADQAEASGEK